MPIHSSRFDHQPTVGTFLSSCSECVTAPCGRGSASRHPSKQSVRTQATWTLKDRLCPASNRTALKSEYGSSYLVGLCVHFGICRVFPSAFSPCAHGDPCSSTAFSAVPPSSGFTSFLRSFPPSSARVPSSA